MHLTFVNYIMRKRPHGYVFRGKYRKVKQVTTPALFQKHAEYEMQEKNMLLLRHPYLTVEQSKGHMAGLKEDRIKKFYSQREEKFSKHFTWAEQLSHLRVKDAWE